MAKKGASEIGKNGGGDLVSKGTGKALDATGKASKDTPFLGQLGTETVQTVGGSVQLTGGIARGNAKDIKEGASNLGKGVLSALTGGPLRSLNTPPPRQYIGGSPEAMEAARARNEAGILSGAGMT